MIYTDMGLIQADLSKVSTLFMIANEFATKLITKFENNSANIDLQTFFQDELQSARKIDKDIFELLQTSLVAE